MIVEKAVSQWGQPNGYILGEEASGAFVGGLRYGDGTLYTRNAGDVRVFWEGPMGLTNEGKVASFGGIVQSLENGHSQYADYPLRITMK